MSVVSFAVRCKSGGLTLGKDTANWISNSRRSCVAQIMLHLISFRNFVKESRKGFHVQCFKSPSTITNEAGTSSEMSGNKTVVQVCLSVCLSVCLCVCVCVCVCVYMCVCLCVCMCVCLFECVCGGGEGGSQAAISICLLAILDCIFPNFSSVALGECWDIILDRTTILQSFTHSVHKNISTNKKHKLCQR
jgi:hypothetical protein